MNKIWFYVLVMTLLIGWEGSVLAVESEPSYRIVFKTAEGQKQKVVGDKSEILGLAERLTDHGDFESARICYQRILSRNPQDIRTHLLMGNLYEKHFINYAQAIMHYKRATALVPKSQIDRRAYCHRVTAEALRVLAEKTDSLIFFVQAISEYEKILALKPQDPEIMFYAASCRLNSSDYDRAINLFEQVIDANPSSSWARLSKKGIRVARRESRASKKT
jgi:tetratricopeptide (TPR) repeat protein